MYAEETKEAAAKFDSNGVMGLVRRLGRQVEAIKRRCRNDWVALDNKLRSQQSIDMVATTVKKPSENSPIKRARRRRCKRKQTPQNRVNATKGNAPKPCKCNERKELGENCGRRPASYKAGRNAYPTYRQECLSLAGQVM